MITGERFLRHWARYFLIAVDDNGVPIARALSVPPAFPAGKTARNCRTTAGTRPSSGRPRTGWTAARRTRCARWKS
jgi:hypothetical protein